MVLMVKNSPPTARDTRDMGLIPGLGRSLRGGIGYPLQYSCLENPHGPTHRVPKSRTRLKQLSTLACKACLYRFLSQNSLSGDKGIFLPPRTGEGYFPCRDLSPAFKDQEEGQSVPLALAVS